MEKNYPAFLKRAYKTARELTKMKAGTPTMGA
jgi:hypothetical protein